MSSTNLGLLIIVVGAAALQLGLNPLAATIASFFARHSGGPKSQR